jgi:hypothetical protein
MGKCTGCYIRTGRVKATTPKQPPQDKKKKKGFRAGNRRKLYQHTKVAASNTTPNSNSEVKKFGDTTDPQTKLEVQLLPKEREPKSFGPSHHQEGGKQWARQTKEERQAKMQVMSPGDDFSGDEVSTEKGPERETY